MSVTDRQVERAWIEHDPRRAKIPASAWRSVRIFKRSLAAPAAAIQRALDDTASVKLLVHNFVRKRATGRKRALMRLKQKFAGAELVVAGDCFELRFLEPRDDSLIRDPRDLGEAQPSTVAFFAVAGPSNLKRSSCMLCSVSIEIPSFGKSYASAASSSGSAAP